MDYDSVRFHLSTPIKKTEIWLSMAVKCWKDLVKYGALEIIEREFGQWLSKETEDGFDVTLKFEVDQVPELGGTYALVFVWLLGGKGGKSERGRGEREGKAELGEGGSDGLISFALSSSWEAQTARSGGGYRGSEVWSSMRCRSSGRRRERAQIGPPSSELASLSCDDVTL